MLWNEFETITNFEVTASEYDVIDSQYNKDTVCADKREFCEKWLKSGGIGKILKARSEGNIELDPVKRYTDIELVELIIKQAKNAGELEKVAKIRASAFTQNGQHNKVILTNYNFKFLAAVEFGSSEGMYLNCWLQGEFDESGQQTCDVATFKTLNDDLESMKIMAEFGGVLTFYADEFVRKNIDNFTPDEERKQEAIAKAKREYAKWLEEFGEIA